MYTVKYFSGSVADTEYIGSVAAKVLLSEYPGRLFIELEGPLGAGKTAFVRGIASVISPGSRVKSPSYTIVNEYRAGGVPLFHFDLYRLGDGSDLEDFGFSEYIKNGHCVVEWSEFLSGGESDSPVKVLIVPIGENSRKIEITYP